MNNVDKILRGMRATLLSVGENKQMSDHRHPYYNK